MTLFDERPQVAKGDPLEDSDTQPEKTDRFRTRPPSTFVKRPMRERTGGGGPVIFVGVRSGRAASQVEREAGTDPTAKEPS